MAHAFPGHWVNDVISMFSLHNQAEKSCFYLINLIAIKVTKIKIIYQSFLVTGVRESLRTCDAFS